MPGGSAEKCSLFFEWTAKVSGPSVKVDVRFLNSSSTYLETQRTTSCPSMLGTRRMLNLPTTRAGITVLLPGSEKAPSIP